MSSRRNKLQKLSKLELIKICTLWKVSTNGTKEEMVDLIIENSLENNTEQTTDTQKQQPQTELRTNLKDNKAMSDDIITFTEEKDALITFIFTVEIQSEEALDEDDTADWDTRNKTIQLKKNEITYTLLHNKIEEIYPFVLECVDEDDDEEWFEWDIYDSNLQITTDKICKLINEREYENEQIDLTILITDISMHIVIDNGSYWMRAGFGGDDAPRSVFPTIVGIPTSPSFVDHDVYIGDEAQSKRHLLALRRGIDQKRQISSWEDMEKIWRHTFGVYELRILYELEECDNTINVLLTDSFLTPKVFREKMMQIMFETFNVKSCYIAYQPVLALIASGRVNGIVLDSGWGTTECTPIYNGKVISEGVTVSYFGGNDITHYLCKILNNNPEPNCNFTTISEREIVKDIKEKLCYAKMEYMSGCSKIYELSDGYVIEISDEERYMPVECLFNPKLMGKDNEDGIHELIYKSIMKCNVNVQYELLNNIILCGGNTMFPGIEERLMYELENIKHNNEMVVNGYIRKYNNNKLFYNDIMNLLYEYSTLTKTFKVIAPPERKYSVWIGGSILSSHSTFKDKWITKGEYNKFGAEIVHKKSQRVPIKF